jgi:hypothetical protein
LALAAESPVIVAPFAVIVMNPFRWLSLEQRSSAQALHSVCRQGNRLRA